MEMVGKDTELMEVLASLLQRACVDPDFWDALQRLAVEEEG